MAPVREQNMTVVLVSCCRTCLIVTFGVATKSSEASSRALYKCCEQVFALCCREMLLLPLQCSKVYDICRRCIFHKTEYNAAPVLSLFMLSYLLLLFWIPICMKGRESVTGCVTTES